MVTYILNEPINNRILPSLALQKTNERNRIITFGGKFDKTLKSRSGEMQFRAQMIQKAIESQEQFIVMNDDDILHIKEDNLQCMKNFLAMNDKYGAVALLRDDNASPKTDYHPQKYPHVCIASVMIRKDALCDVSFEDRENRALCVSFGTALHNAGWKYGYVDLEPRIRHLKNGVRNV